MRLTGSSLRFVAGIALLAILAGALMPAIGHAFADEQRGAGWLEVCTVEGVKVVALDDGPPDPPRLALEHCPYCLSHTKAMPCALAVAAPFPARSALAPPSAGDSAPPRSFPEWFSAPPRAPPTAAL